MPQDAKDGYYTIGGKADTRTDEIIAPKGYYARSGELFKCPAGTFGNVTGLAREQCSGKCRGGYYCPAGSTTDKQFPCGKYQFCPPGMYNGRR